MATISEVSLAHTPAKVYVALFRDVKNAGYLRSQLLAANPDFEYALIDASKVVSTRHVLAAAFRAINDMTHARLKTRNVHSEIVFSFATNNNIADAFRRFGVAESTTNLIAIKVVLIEPWQSHYSRSLESIQNHLQASVNGTAVTFDDEALATMRDLDAIRKLYRLNGPSATAKRRGVAGGTDDNRLDSQEIETNVLAIMALKGS